MVAVLGLYYIACAPGAELEDHVLELLGHVAAAEVPEVPAVRGLRAERHPPGDLGEVLRRERLFYIARLVLRAYDDHPGVDLLGQAELFRVLPVVREHGLVADLNARVDDKAYGLAHEELPPER